MKHLVLAVTAMLLMSSILLSGEPAQPDTVKEKQYAEPPAGIKEKLSRKITFEFVDTPFEEAIGFIRSIANINIIMDPKAIESNNAPITLRVQDMDLGTALRWIAKLCDMEIRFLDDSIFITETAEKTAAKRAALKQQEELKQNELKAGQKLRIKYPDGNEVELEGAIAREHAGDLLKRMDRRPSGAETGVIFFRLDTELVKVPKDMAIRLIQKTATGCDIAQDGRLMIITSKDTAILRRVENLIDYLRNQKDQLIDDAPKPDGHAKNPPAPPQEKNAF